MGNVRHSVTLDVGMDRTGAEPTIAWLEDKFAKLAGQWADIARSMASPFVNQAPGAANMPTGAAPGAQAPAAPGIGPAMGGPPAAVAPASPGVSAAAPPPAIPGAPIAPSSPGVSMAPGVAPALGAAPGAAPSSPNVPPPSPMGWASWYAQRGGPAVNFDPTATFPAAPPPWTPPPPPKPPPRDEAKERQQAALAQQLGQIGTHAIIGGGIGLLSGGPGAPLNALGGGLTGIGASLPLGLGAGIAALGSLAMVGGSAVNQYYGLGREKASIDAQLYQARMLGGGAGWDDLRAATAYGFGPSEAASMAAGYAGGTGGGRVRGLADVASLARIGLGPGSQAAFDALEARGAGGYTRGTGAPIHEIGAQAAAMGLRGSALEGFLGEIAANTRQMVAQGVSTDLSDVRTTLARMRATGVDFGVQAPRIIGGVRDVQGAALSQMLGGYRQAGQAAIVARAASGADGFEDFIARLQGMQPSELMDAISSGLGSDAASLFYAGQGVPMVGARKLGAGLPEADARRLEGRALGASAAPTIVSRFAEADINRFQGLTDKHVERLIETQEKLDATMRALATGLMPLINGMWGMLDDMLGGDSGPGMLVRKALEPFLPPLRHARKGREKAE